MWFSFLSIYGPRCRAIMPHVAHILYVCCRFSYSIYNIADLHFLIYCIYTHIHMRAHELQSGYIEILLWMFQYVWQFIFSLKIFFLTNKIFFETQSMSRVSYNLFHSFPPHHMRPFLPPRRIVSIRQTFVFFCLMSWQYHQSNESLMTAGNPYTFQFNGRDSVTKDVTKRSVGNIYLYQDTNDRPATC